MKPGGPDSYHKPPKIDWRGRRIPSSFEYFPPLIQNAGEKILTQAIDEIIKDPTQAGKVMVRVWGVAGLNQWQGTIDLEQSFEDRRQADNRLVNERLVELNANLHETRAAARGVRLVLTAAISECGLEFSEDRRSPRPNRNEPTNEAALAGRHRIPRLWTICNKAAYTIASVVAAVLPGCGIGYGIGVLARWINPDIPTHTAAQVIGSCAIGVGIASLIGLCKPYFILRGQQLYVEGIDSGEARRKVGQLWIRFAMTQVALVVLIDSIVQQAGLLSNVAFDPNQGDAQPHRLALMLASLVCVIPMGFAYINLGLVRGYAEANHAHLAELHEAEHSRALIVVAMLLPLYQDLRAEASALETRIKDTTKLLRNDLTDEEKLRLQLRFHDAYAYDNAFREAVAALAPKAESLAASQQLSKGTGRRWIWLLGLL